MNPIFVGWLNAKAKSGTKKPLPKGLAKAASTSLPVKNTAGKPTTSSNPPSKKVIPAAKPIVKKKEHSKPAEEEVEGWGDEWD